MKRLMTLMLALAFMTGSVAVCFAQEQPKKEEKKKSGKKKKSEKKEEKKG